VILLFNPNRCSNKGAKDSRGGGRIHINPRISPPQRLCQGAAKQRLIGQLLQQLLQIGPANHEATGTTVRPKARIPIERLGRFSLDPANGLPLSRERRNTNEPLEPRAAATG
jgi:hypothetical protein